MLSCADCAASKYESNKILRSPRSNAQWGKAAGGLRPIGSDLLASHEPLAVHVDANHTKVRAPTFYEMQPMLPARPVGALELRP